MGWPVTGAEKARENRLRRLAERRDGMWLSRVRRLRRDAWDYGHYELAPYPEHPLWLDAHEDDLQPRWFESLDEVEDFLRGKLAAQERVERRAARRRLTIERATIEGAPSRAIWLSSQTDDVRWGPFWSFDEVDSYMRAAPEHRPPREWRRTPLAP